MSSYCRKILVLSFILAICPHFSTTDAPRSFGQISREVGFKFLNALDRQSQNVFFSPTTLTSLYGMLFTASDGQLKSELLNIVFKNMQEQDVYDMMKKYRQNLADLNAGNVKMTSENRLFYQQDVNNDILPSRDFNNLMSDIFGSSADRVDFTNSPEFARARLNQWALDKSGGLINDLFRSGSIDSYSIMAAGSEASLNGNFTYGFNRKKNSQKLFYPNANTATIVESMTQTCSKLYYGENDVATAVGLPYGIKEQVVVYIILPKEKQGLVNLEENLAQDDALMGLIDLTINNAKVVTINLPKFKMDLVPYDVRYAYMLMGTTTSFAPGFVDFSKINNKKNLYVSNAEHKSYFEAHEGTVRACISEHDDMLDKVTFDVKEPFIVAIVDKGNRNLLFYGHVVSLY